MDNKISDMNIVITIFSFLLAVLNAILTPVFWLRSRNKRKYVPSIKDDILRVSACDLAEKIRNRVISSEKICSAYIERIKEVNGYLNAVVEERFEAAVKEAKEVDKYLLNSGYSKEDLENEKPLLGVPITVKESCSLAGHSLSVGTLNRNGIKADKDGDAVARLKESGAIPLLVSNTPEICLSWECFNFITGRTNNPYDTTRTSSGSSGGEGALLGAGASLIGVGSDIAGSIRLPAMFNGVFGHKPSPRLIPIKGHYPYCNDEKYPDYLVVGPMTRYAKDLTLVTKIMAGAEKTKLTQLNKKVDLNKIRIFSMEDAQGSLVQPKVQEEIKEAIRVATKYLQNECGAQVVPDKFPELANSNEISSTVLYSLKDIPNLLKGEHQNLAVEIIKSLVGLSKYTFNLLFFYALQNVVNSLISNEVYHKENARLREKFMDRLGDDGVFLFPTFPSSAFMHGQGFLKIDSVMYLMIFNTLGLPATHVPCGIDKNGLPIGIQVVAAANQDRLCLAVAEKLEKCFGGWNPPPAK